MYRNIFRTLFIRTLICVLLFCFCSPLQADDWINTQYNTTEGNEFYVTTMKNAGASRNNAPDVKIYLYATARYDTRICITNNANYTRFLSIPAGGQRGISIPFEYVYSDESEAITDTQYSVEDTLAVTLPQDKSLYIYTCNADGSLNTSESKRVSIYITNYYVGNGYEATNILPIESLEREYMVQTYHTDSYATEFTIIATENNQEFNLSVRLNESTDEGDTIVYETIKTFKCNKGQTRVIRSAEQAHSFVGTTICSLSKFALLNGNQFAQIPSGNDPSSHIFEQAPSADKWGNEYIVTRTYGHNFDFVLLTALEDNTIITKDGSIIATLSKGATFTDILDKETAYYSSNNKFLCYLYETSRGYDESVNFGSPAMTTITPTSMGINSIVIAAFNATAQDLGLDGKKASDYNQIANHYINIVTENKYAEKIFLGNTKINGFKRVPGNNNYSYVMHQLDMGNMSRLLKCADQNGTFTVRMYGESYNSRKKPQRVSYAYSAGSRVNRSVDMLINDKYTDYETICLNKGVKFTSLINFEYDDLQWVIGDSVRGDSIVKDFRFDTIGIYDVSLIVYSHSPICENILVDTVKAKVEVTDLFYRSATRDICYGEEFNLQRNGVSVTLRADTSKQIWDGKEFRFQLNNPKSFYDTIPPKDNNDTSCDSVIRQIITIRPTYDTIVEISACDEYVWEHVSGKDTTHVWAFSVQPTDILPVTKIHKDSFLTKYGCDSIVTLSATLNRSYEFSDTVTVCQTEIGGKFIWDKHETIDIPLDSAGTFTYVDAHVTEKAPHCDSVHTLVLIVKPRYDMTEVVNICQNDTFYWKVNDQRYVGSQFADIKSTDKVITELNKTISFVEKFETETYGCDSIHRLEIKVYPSYDTTYVEYICDNQIYKLNDTIAYYGDKYKADGLAAQDTAYKFDHFFTTKEGCDSIVRLELLVHPTYEVVEDTAVCQQGGGIFTWDNHTSFFSVAQNKQVTTIPIDQPDTYQYIDYQKTSNGCDSVHTLNITVRPTYFVSQDTVLSNEDKIEWEDLLIAGKDAGVINRDYIITKDTIIQVRYDSKDMCDSILQLNITYGEIFRDTTYGVACDNDKVYEWYWENDTRIQYLKDVDVPNLASTYEFTEKRKSNIGVDSLFYLYLTVNPTYQYAEVDTICDGNQYIWQVKDANGDYVSITDSIFDEQNGRLISSTDIPTTLVDNHDIPQTFKYTYNLKTKVCATCPAEGCDSVYCLTLTILPQYDRTDTLTMCDNDSIQWNGEWFYGYKYGHASPIKGDTLITREYRNDYGCLSYKRLRLMVLSSYLDVSASDTIYKHLCENEKYETNSGKIYNANSEWDTPDGMISRYVVVDTIQTKTGCDSVVAHVVYVHPTYHYFTYDTICQNDDYEWTVYNENGDSIKTIVNDIYNSQNQLVDSISTLQYGVFEYKYFTKTCELCTNSIQCDSIHTLYLTILPRENTIDTIWMCDNDSVQWSRNGKWIYGTKSQSMHSTTYSSNIEPYRIVESANNIHGCDYEEILILYVHPSYQEPVRIDTIDRCDNETYLFYGEIYNANGEWKTGDSLIHTYTLTYRDTTTHGCDSTIMHVVKVHPTYPIIPTYDTICQTFSESYLWDNHSYPVFSQEQNQYVSSISIDSAGNFIYIDSLKTSVCEDCPTGGCDSIHVLYLTVLRSYNIVDTLVYMSNEDTFTWDENGVTYCGENASIAIEDSIVYVPIVYPDTFVVKQEIGTNSIGTYSCDSIRMLKIVIGEVFRDTINGVACSNEPYLWMGHDSEGRDSIRKVIDVPKDSIYIDKHVTTLGFDSVFYLNLTVLPSYVDMDTMTSYISVCQYTDYKWFRGDNECSNKLFCATNQRWISSDSISTDIPGEYIYIDSLQTQSGCDSIYTLHLYVEPVYRDTISVNMCENDYVVWEHTIYKGAKCTDVPLNDTLPIVTLLPQLNYFVDTTYVTSDGCDSTKCLNLNVYPIYASVDTAVIGDNNSPYIWVTRDSYGAYYDTIHFTQKPMYFDPITQVYKKDTMVITDRYHTLTSVNGCDSVANLHLVINPTYLFLTEDTICSGDYYVWRGYSKHWTGGGLIVVKDSFQTAAGCDSIYQLNLYLKPNSVTHRYREVCYNDTVYHEDFLVWGPGMSTEDNIKDVLYVNVEGCDSIIRYHITLHPTYNIGTDSVYTICANETFELHKSYIYTPELKYYEPGEIAPIVEVFISDTLQTTTCPKCPDKACDSIYSAHLRILPVYKHVDFDTICSVDTVVWRGINCFQPQAGNYTYYDSLLTSSGCDSIYELHLRVKQSYNIALPPDTICADDSIFFAGRYVNQSGIYLDTMSTIDQCDSIIYLELTVLDTTSLTIYDTICVTEKYLLDTLYSNRRIFTESGFYVDTALNEWGCKHYTYLYLEVIDTTKYTLEIGNICADDEEISIYYTYTGRHLIEYSILFDSLGIAQGFEDIYHAPLDSKQSSIHIPIPQGPALPHPEPTYFDSKQGVNTFVYDDKYTYPQPNKYRITVIMHNGICGDTLQRKDTSFQIMYPSWIHEQHWNDGIILYNDTYNGGYKFSSYQWYQNGEPLVGETKEYLYLPGGLLLNNRGDCDNYYQVQLTREEDGYSTLTCPICPIYLTKDTIVPCLDYFSIVPTLVVKENPVVHILSTMRGTCMGYDMAGNQLFEPFDFVPDGNNYAGAIVLPVSQSGMINIRLTTQDGDTRMFKVLVK